MDLEGIMLREISQIDRDKYCMKPLTCQILRKKNSLVETVEKWLLGAERGGENMKVADKRVKTFSY